MAFPCPWKAKSLINRLEERKNFSPPRLLETKGEQNLNFSSGHPPFMEFHPRVTFVNALNRVSGMSLDKCDLWKLGFLVLLVINKPKYWVCVRPKSATAGGLFRDIRKSRKLWRREVKRNFQRVPSAWSITVLYFVYIPSYTAPSWINSPPPKKKAANDKLSGI